MDIPIGMHVGHARRHGIGVRMDMYRDVCAYRHECMFISVQMCIGRVYGRG